MMSTRRRARGMALAVSVASFSLLIAGCTAGASSPDTQTKAVTITVALASPPPPKAALAAFTKSTGITVKWSNIDWPDLQTKITTAAEANTYFADATDVDWSRVGQLGKLNWFLPMEKYVNTKELAADMPQLSSFTSDGHVVGIPYDASFTVTTVNKQLFSKAGITTMPTTIDSYTKDLEQIKAKGVVQYPLNIPFAAVEGLSTYWYQTTAAFGGTILNKSGKPQFGSPDSAGYRAAQWMINAFKTGLVPPGNINIKGGAAQQTLMAKGLVASTFSDYAGNVGSLYDIPASSTVVGQVEYLPTPGVNGTASNLSNPDGIGIPKAAKHPAAAAKFIEWLVSAQNQADFAGANGANEVWSGGYTLPSRLSAISTMVSNGKLAGGAKISSMLKSSQPVFPNGAPTWYPQFSNVIYTSLHAAAAGSMSVADAINQMVASADKLSSGS